MTRKYVVVSCVMVGAIIASGSWMAVSASPLQQAPQSAVQSSKGPGPLEKTAKPITPENPIPRRLVADNPDYPADLAGAHASVTLRVTLDATGRVAEARTIGISYRTPQFSVSMDNLDSKVWEGMARGSGGGAEAATAVKPKLENLVNTTIDAVKNWSYEPPADAPISFAIAFSFDPEGATTSSQIASPPPPRAGMGGIGGVVGSGPLGGVASSSPMLWEGQAPVRVGGNIKPPTKIRDVRPVYPPEAQSARVQGVVIVEALIAPDGSVGNVKILRSIPLLDQAAIDAVMQWQFTPTLVNGAPVPVIMTVTVNFTLQ